MARNKKRKMPFIFKLMLWMLILPWIGLVALAVATNLIIALYS